MTLDEKRRQEAAWMTYHGCTRVRCPRGCQHPFPFFADGLMWCGSCWHLEGLATEVIPDGDAQRLPPALLDR